MFVEWVKLLNWRLFMDDLVLAELLALTEDLFYSIKLNQRVLDALLKLRLQNSSQILLVCSLVDLNLCRREDIYLEWASVSIWFLSWWDGRSRSEDFFCKLPSLLFVSKTSVKKGSFKVCPRRLFLMLFGETVLAWLRFSKEGDDIYYLVWYKNTSPFSVSCWWSIIEHNFWFVNWISFKKESS